MAAQHALEALVDQMTLRDLADRGNRSVAEIVEWALKSSPRKTTADAVPRRSAAVSAASVDVRNASGRTAYDSAVLDILSGASGPSSAQDVRRKVGGTPAQARAALNRLYEGGKIGFEGRARATRYFPKK